jgi:hypothetical protein
MSTEIVRSDWGPGGEVRGGADNLPATTEIRTAPAGTIAGHAATAVAVVQGSLTPEDFAALDSSFTTLPVAILDVLRDELTVRPDNKARPVSDAVVAKFRSDPAGEILASEWKWRTDEKVAVLHQRLARIVSNLSPADREAAIAWCENLNVAQTVAVVAALAGET